MGWEDRPYYRDRGSSTNRVMDFLNGSTPLFTAFGIKVRALNLLFVFIAAEISLDLRPGYTLPVRVMAMSILFVEILLHEFGHCFVGRWVGGTAEEILMWPLGGLAFPHVPHRPGALFWTVAGGPLVNVAICLLSAIAVWFLTPASYLLAYRTHLLVPFNPFALWPPAVLSWGNAAFYCWWAYILSYLGLLFNLLPIYPLDGGQLVQAVLWKIHSYYKSMILSTMVGMTGSVILAIVFLMEKEWIMTIIAASLFYESYKRRKVLREAGAPDPWQSDSMDFSASLQPQAKSKPRRGNKRAVRIARKRVREEIAEREQIDTILAKVSAHGMHSLTWMEKRTLRKATDRQRKRDLQLRSMFKE